MKKTNETDNRTYVTPEVDEIIIESGNVIMMSNETPGDENE